MIFLISVFWTAEALFILDVSKNKIICLLSNFDCPLWKNAWFTLLQGVPSISSYLYAGYCNNVGTILIGHPVFISFYFLLFQNLKLTCFHEFFNYESTIFFPNISQLEKKTNFLLVHKGFFFSVVSIWKNKNKHWVERICRFVLKKIVKTCCEFDKNFELTWFESTCSTRFAAMEKHEIWICCTMTSPGPLWTFFVFIYTPLEICTIAIRVVEFPNGGHKIRKIFA